MWPQRPLTDVGVPAAIALLATVETVGLAPPGMWAALGLAWFCCAVLVWRRLWPLATGTLAGLSIVAIPYVGPQLEELSTPVLVLGLATFTLARHVADLRGLLPFALILVVLGTTAGMTKETPNITDIVFVAVILAPPFVFGRVLRLVEDRNRLLAAERAAAEREAMAVERARMAREVHDLIAHTVSVMTIQAAAAEDLVHGRPDEAVAALRRVQDAGRGALSETGRLVRLLRDGEGDVELAPERDARDLEALVGEFRGGGLAVALTVEGDVTGLPAGVSVSTYRVLREVLTNAIRHAPDRRVDVRVCRRADALDIHAENAAGAPAAGRGLGLVGIAERVAVHGGRMTHGRNGDRFRLDVIIPLAAQ
jgi:signal transduction histidine kinase